MKIIKNKKYFISIIVSLSFAIGLFFVALKTANATHAYAMEQESTVVSEAQSLENISNASLLSGNKKSDNVVLLEGTNNLLEPMATGIRSDLTEVKYIPNANYFLLNPKHHVNDGTDNKGGTCTTVAIQLLLGYHNYYSDRRIIPSSFLASDYGDIDSDPYFDRINAGGQGCSKIGTDDGVYDEIFNRTPLSDVTGIGQAIPLVVDGTISFINQFAYDDIVDDISLTWGTFSATQARTDIDEGKPIVLGMDLLLEGNMHVVLAYGYAKLDGVDGFLVHYGWGDIGTLVWVPENLFGFQVRMDVNHVHDLTATGTIVNKYAQELLCAECGYKTLDMLYNTEASTITSIRYTISNNLAIPSSIDYYYEDTATFASQSIASIGNSVFANQTQITSITLPNTVTSIGHDAFAGCTNLSSISSLNYITLIGDRAFKDCAALTNITIPAGLANIGAGAFAGCNSLNISVNANNPNYSVQGNVLYNKAKTKIIASGDIATNITIPKTVTEIGAYAFYSNDNLGKIHIYGTPTIGNFAFFECENLEAVYFYSYTVPTMGTSAFTNNTFTLYVPHSKQSLYNTEFVGYTNSIDSIPIVVTFMKDGEVYETLSTYYGANIIDLTDPFKEGYIFNYWTDDSGNTYQNGGIWDSAENLTVEANWTARQCYINFVGYGTEEIADKLVTYDEPIGELPVPTSSGPVFMGWKDEHDVYYNANDIWKRTSNLTLTADFNGIEDGNVVLYNVVLNQDSGTGGSDTVSAEYGAPMPSATAPTRTGYTFQGYYTETNGGGVQYYNADMSSARNWDIASDKTLYAYWLANTYTVTFEKQGGSGGSSSVTVSYGSSMPTATAPTKLGYTFMGYYVGINSTGAKYYDADMSSVNIWTETSDTTLYAYWVKTDYTITLVLYDGITDEVTVNYGEKIEVDYAPYREHYEFVGYYSAEDGGGICYVRGETQLIGGLYQMKAISTSNTWRTDRNGTLYAYWVRIQENIQYDVISMDEGYLDPQTVNLTSGQQTTLTAPSLDGYTFDHWTINGVTYTTPSVTYTFTLHRSYVTGEITIYHYTGGSATYSDGYMSISFQKNADDGSCVAAGTLITLADGRQIPVETLTGNEMLLVWNLNTGRFDTAPILFIDHDSAAMYKIINLYFSNGTHVKVIDEHAFWDFDLNQYVFLREDAAQYLGHWFNKQTTDENGNLIWTRVQLTNVTISEEYTTAWSPVTYGHLCIYVNGMLSMPGATTGLINIFEVNGDTMQIDQAKYLADIETYGLFTYEEFAAIYPVSEEIFEAFNGQYLKVAIGKGLLDQETLSALIVRYAEFFK